DRVELPPESVGRLPLPLLSRLRDLRLLLPRHIADLRRSIAPCLRCPSQVVRVTGDHLDRLDERVEQRPNDRLDLARHTVEKALELIVDLDLGHRGHQAPPSCWAILPNS